MNVTEKSEYSARIEKEISKLFQDKGFQAIHSLDWENDQSGQKGEIDIIAVKNNQIFIIELKITHLRTETTSIYQYKDRVIYGKAISQLSNSEKYLIDEEGWKELPKNLKKEISGDPIVHKYILTNSFEGDGEIYDKGIEKLSIFELRVILENNAVYLSDCLTGAYITALNMLGKTLADLEVDPSIAEDESFSQIVQGIWDAEIQERKLWKDPTNIDPTMLAEVIHEKKVWKDLIHISKDPRIVKMKYSGKEISVEI